MGYSSNQILSMYNTRMRSLMTRIQRDEEEQDAIAYNELLDKQKRNTDLAAMLSVAKFGKDIREGIIHRKLAETDNELVIEGTLGKKYQYKEGTTFKEYLKDFGKSLEKDVSRFIDPLEETTEYTEFKAEQEKQKLLEEKRSRIPEDIPKETQQMPIPAEDIAEEMTPGAELEQFIEETGQEYTPEAFAEWQGYEDVEQFETDLGIEDPDVISDIELTEEAELEKLEGKRARIPEDIPETTQQMPIPAEDIAEEMTPGPIAAKQAELAVTPTRIPEEGEFMYMGEGVGKTLLEKARSEVQLQKQLTEKEVQLQKQLTEKEIKAGEYTQKPIPTEDIVSEFGAEGGKQSAIKQFMEETGEKYTPEAFERWQNYEDITGTGDIASGDVETIEDVIALGGEDIVSDDKQKQLSAIVPDAKTPVDIVPGVKPDVKPDIVPDVKPEVEIPDAGIFKTGADVIGKGQEVLSAASQIKELTSGGELTEADALAGGGLAGTIAEKVGGKLTEKAIETGAAKVAEKTGEVVATKAGEKVAGKALSFAGKALGAGVGIYSGLKTAFDEEASDVQKVGGGLQAVGSGLMMSGVGAPIGMLVGGAGALMSMFGGDKPKAAKQKRRFDPSRYYQRRRR